MYKIKNQSDGDVRITIRGIEVFVPVGGETIVKDEVGRELQEIQPQLEYFYVEATPKKPKVVEVKEPKKVKKTKATTKKLTKKDGKKR